MTRPIRELLQEPWYRRNLATPVVLPKNLTHNNPYRVWAHREDDRWVKKDLPTYRDSYALVKKLLSATNEQWPRVYRDVAIVSLRRLVPPMADATWRPEEDWCSRCRRPVVFGFFRRHHALEGHQRYSSEATLRCPYCGMRKMAMPDYPGDGK